MSNPSRARVEIDRTIGSDSIVLADYGAVTAQPDHAHEYSTISFVVSGEVVEHARGRKRRLGPGAVLVKPAGVVHSDAFLGDRARVLALRRGSASFDRGRPAPAGDYAIRREPDLTAAFFRLERELEAGAATARLVLLIDALASALEGSPVRRGPVWCDAIAEAIEAEPETDTARLAARRGMHPVYLARAFRARFGSSPSAFARRVRLERAAASVASGVAIARAAGDAGFSDQAHFTRWFGAEFGITPGQYRKTVDR